MNSIALRLLISVFFGSCAVFLCCSLIAQTTDPIVGFWIAVDEKTGHTAIIELELRSDELSGTIVKLLDARNNEINPECNFCSDKRAKGMKFLTGLRKTGEKWVGGTVIDMRPDAPIPGFPAACDLELRGNEVVLTGWPKYLGFPKGKDKWRRNNVNQDSFRSSDPITWFMPSKRRTGYKFDAPRL